MTTENVKTKIEKVFTLSEYKNGGHIIDGYIDGGEPSFAESMSPVHLMIDCFKYRPLGTKIKVTMEEIN
jgi:hypothetical protein